MDDAADPIRIIDLPSQLLDKVTEVLAKVGIDLPALVLQLFLLVLVLLALFVAVRSLLPDWRKAKPLPLLGAGAISLIAIGILFGIGSQMLLPRTLSGRVAGPALAGVRVELLDHRAEAVSAGGTVDTQTGEFIAYYSPAWSGRARTLRISSAECKQRDHAIPRGRLARGTESIWDFPCEKP
jgi:hypothetical protein